MTWINQDPAVNAEAVTYFRWRVVSLIPVAMIFCFRGYWNGIQRTGLYLRIMLAMHLVNGLASAGLIFGLAGLPAMGAAGAGAGTTLSLYVGLAIWPPTACVTPWPVVFSPHASSRDVADDPAAGHSPLLPADMVRRRLRDAVLDPRPYRYRQRGGGSRAGEPLAAADTARRRSGYGGHELVGQSLVGRTIATHIAGAGTWCASPCLACCFWPCRCWPFPRRFWGPFCTMPISSRSDGSPCSSPP